MIVKKLVKNTTKFFSNLPKNSINGTIPTNMENEFSRQSYFRNLAFNHLPEMRLLFQGGKLKSRDGWRNVVEHSLVQAAEVKVVAALLELPSSDSKSLVRATLCHDWDQRHTKK